MKKNITAAGNAIATEAVISEIVQNNIDAAKLAPKPAAKGSSRAWLQVEAYLRKAKAEKEERIHSKKVRGRAGDS